MLKFVLRCPLTRGHISTRAAAALRATISDPKFRVASKIQSVRNGSTINTIVTSKSYTPVGHYSQAFSANGQVWVAGQLALDAEGNMIRGTMTEQAHQICKNIDEILKAAGSSAEKAVKVTCFVTDFSLLPEFNAVYNTYFPQKPPRTSVEVSRLPLDSQIEVDVIAVI